MPEKKKPGKSVRSVIREKKTASKDPVFRDNPEEDGKKPRSFKKNRRRTEPLAPEKGGREKRPGRRPATTPGKDTKPPVSRHLKGERPTATSKGESDKPKFYEKFVRKGEPAPSVERGSVPHRQKKKSGPGTKKSVKPSAAFGIKRKSTPAPPFVSLDEPMRLNKYVAHCGIAARRQAAELVKQGFVTVNGKVELNPGYLVQPADEVNFKGKKIKPEERKVYILMNKPKDVITTASDEKARKTVLDIVGKKIRERIFPVGRLDRMTTGLLLLTNDGDLAEKLSHPSHKVTKFYQASLDKPLSKPDLEKIRKGLELDDGLAQVDGIDYVEGKKDEVGIELHIGKNRIVRRIFEHLGYQVVRLDRTYYAGLTKKDLGRGHFRHLTEQEIIMLKHFK